AAGTILYRFHVPSFSLERNIAFSAHGEIAAVAAHEVLLLDSLTGQPLRALTYNDRINDVAISDDGVYVLAGSSNGMAALWEAKTGDLVRQLGEHVGQVLSVAFCRDARYALTGTSTGTAVLWDVQ